MGEYQYYEFLAVDRALTPAECSALRRISTRAAITSTSFTNEYNWGDLNADSMDLLRRYFDVHVYVANWGSRTFAMRLPPDALSAAERKAYLPRGNASVRKHRGCTVVALFAEDEDPDGGEWEDVGGALASLTPIRAELLAGDVRPLYLAWLLGVHADDVADGRREPPVPAGLRDLTAAQDALASFLRIDPHLLAVAAEASGPQEDTLAGLSGWVEGLSAAQKDRLLTRVARGESQAVQSELLCRFAQDQRGKAAVAPGGRRTAGELRDAAEARRSAAAERERRKRARARKRREAKAAAARKAHLDALAERESAAWEQVEALARERKPKGYDEAVVLLTDLHEVASRREGGLEEFERFVVLLRRRHAMKHSLLGRLDKAVRLGWKC